MSTVGFPRFDIRVVVVAGLSGGLRTKILAVRLYQAYSVVQAGDAIQEGFGVVLGANRPRCGTSHILLRGQKVKVSEYPASQD